MTRLKALKEPGPPSEAELNARRERLIAELCGIANSFTVDDYDPVKLARVIEEEKREMGWHGDDGLRPRLGPLRLHRLITEIRFDCH